VQKKVAAVLRRIQDEPGLSDEEKFLFARSLAATVEERWHLHEMFLRSLGLHKRSARKKCGLLWWE